MDSDRSTCLAINQTLTDYLLVFKHHCYRPKGKHSVVSVILALTAMAPIADAQNSATTIQATPNSNVLAPSAHTVNDPLLNLAPKAERGWQGLAQALEVLAPKVDTSLPLSNAQVSERIAQLLAQGKNEQALQAIENQAAARNTTLEPGTDVQLLFLKARALSGLQQHNEAIRIYQDMTSFYPELPEPWNNLAAEYMLQDKLEMALDSLQMALVADPSYTLARSNMGEIQLMLANQSFYAASQAGSSRARARAQQTLRILQQ